MYLGSVPSAAYVQHLQGLVNRDSRLLVLQCMRTLYRIQREGRDPKAKRVHWVPMGMQHTAMGPARLRAAAQRHDQGARRCPAVGHDAHQVLSPR